MQRLLQLKYQTNFLEWCHILTKFLQLQIPQKTIPCQNRPIRRPTTLYFRALRLPGPGETALPFFADFDPLFADFDPLFADFEPYLPILTP